MKAPERLRIGKQYPYYHPREREGVREGGRKGGRGREGERERENGRGKYSTR